MPLCAACAQPLPDDWTEPICPSCRLPAATVTDTRSTTTLPGWRADALMLKPGQRFASRYAIVAVIGRGGMGSVYRAEDLRLKQTVALKLLRAPRGLPIDAERMASEVRLAREVSDPNVCRVYDIGSESGADYLSMEFVDGQTLTAYLHGRGGVPPPEALNIARQICAGLAAAHERGVLHRDIKPSNIMIDATGRVRILDFGLAVTADGAAESGRAGTPAYMAPEQVLGEPPSKRSDVYALGLVLYELFTGERVYKCSSFAERAIAVDTARLSESALWDVDVTMQAVIRWCLAINPSDRPASAGEVAALLGRGGTLGGSVDLARIPTPELILASAHRGALTPGGAVLMAVAAVAAMLLVAPQVDHLTRLNGAMPKPPADLANEARAIVALIDGPAAVRQGDAAFWFEPDRSATPHDANQPRALRFVYRHHSSSLMPTNLFRVVTLNDPPPAQAGMTMVILDPSGRLLTFEAVTARALAPDERGPDWQWWFDHAGLDPRNYVAADPGPSVGVPHDRQFAWEPRTGNRDAPVVRAALLDNQPRYFTVRDHEAPAEPGAAAVFSTHRSAAAEAFFWTAIVVAFVGAMALVIRNLKRGPGHRQAADRIAVFVGVGGIAASLFRAHHVVNVVEETSFVLGVSGWSLIWAAFCWVCYLALEPPLRRHAPQVLAAWTRLLAGRFRDAVVGRDVLIGVLGGVIVVTLASIRFRLVPGRNADLVVYHALESLQSWRRFTFIEILGLMDAIETALAAALLVVLVRPLVRRVGVAACTVAVIGVPVTIGGIPLSAIDAALAIAVMLINAAVLVRGGLLALATLYLVERFLVAAPLTLDAGAWYFRASTITLALVVALAVYAALVTYFAATVDSSAARRRLATAARSRSS